MERYRRFEKHNMTMPKFYTIRGPRLLAALLTDYGQQTPDAALWQQTRQWSIQGLR